MDEQSAPRPSGNLPQITSSFVGRQADIAEVKRSMEASRLLTLTGPGGVGKTRLAIQSGHRARRAFPDGVWMVDLAAIADGSRIAETIAAAVGLKDHSARSVTEQLTQFLRSRRLLIILDNCEHVILDCGRLVEPLLEQAPQLHVLATSRQPLSIAGERVLALEPLPVPAVDVVPPVQMLMHYESVALLADRAAAAQPRFEITDANRERVAQLCASLDGLPLAIELAAARLRVLSVDQVVERLDDRFRLLTRGNPAARSRQQTLKALIDWSYDLCSESERTLWEALSVFPAEFDLSAAEGICAGPDTGLDRDGILDLLDGLVTKSVVTARAESSQARYRLLETIRQYGRDRLLGRGWEPSLRRRHRDFYLQLAERACSHWCGPRQSEILRLLNRERDNFDAALDWSLSDVAEYPAAQTMVSALRYHWTLGEFLTAGRRRLDEVLTAAREDTVSRGNVLWVAAWVALLQGDHTAADEYLQKCRAIGIRHGNNRLQAYAASLSGTAHLFAGDPDAAVRSFGAGVDQLRREGEIAGMLWVLFQNGVAQAHCGDIVGAEASCTEAIKIARSYEESWAQAEAMWAHGFVRWVAGDTERTAEQLVRDSIAMTPDDNPVSIVLSTELLSWIAASESRFDESAKLDGSAMSMWQSLGTSIDAFGPIFSGHSQRSRAAAVAALGADRFAALADQGCADPRAALGLAAETSIDPSAHNQVHGVTSLTRREREVGRLIAKGLTNRAIAAELVLSRRTVDGHVERLFTKIGVRSRAQAAVWMSTHQLD